MLAAWMSRARYTVNWAQKGLPLGCGDICLPFWASQWSGVARSGGLDVFVDVPLDLAPLGSVSWSNMHKAGGVEAHRIAGTAGPRLRWWRRPLPPLMEYEDWDDKGESSKHKGHAEGFVGAGVPGQRPGFFSEHGG